jgi:hypothetical protein
MGEVRRIGSLEIDEDIEAQKREWKASQIAWVVFTLFVLAGLAGVTGPGPLSRASVGEEGSALRVEYARFAHYQAPERMQVHAVAAGDETELRVWIDRAYADGLDVERISPEPKRVVVGDDRRTYVFDGAGGAQPIEIDFRFECARVGARSCRIGTEGGPTLAFVQFVYP